MQGPVAVHVDVAGDVSFALRIQCLGWLEIENGPRVEVVDRFALGQHRRAGVNGTNPCVLQFKHAQLLFYCAIECHRLRGCWNTGTGVLNSDPWAADRPQVKNETLL